MHKYHSFFKEKRGEERNKEKKQKRLRRRRKIYFDTSPSFGSLAVPSKVETAREKEDERGVPEREAHKTAQPNSSEEMNSDCSKVMVPGAVCVREY